MPNVIAENSDFLITSSFDGSVIEGTSGGVSGGAGTEIAFSVTQLTPLYNSVVLRIFPTTGSPEDFWDTSSNLVNGEPETDLTPGGFAVFGLDQTVEFTVNADSFPEPTEEFGVRIYEDLSASEILLEGSFEILDDDGQFPTDLRPKVSGDNVEGQTLTANISEFTAAANINDYDVQWLRNGFIPIDGANSSSYTLTQDDVGAEISVAVWFTNEFGVRQAIKSSLSDLIQNVNSEPTGSIDIFGPLKLGGVLDAQPNELEDGDGLQSEITFSWLRNGEPIPGADSFTYEITEEDLGSLLALQLTYIDGGGTEESIISDPVQIPDPDAVPENLIREGTSGGDFLLGADGNDTLDGLGGDDTLSGMAGEDDLLGR
ncbi:hypothetical protein SAMN05444413_1332, partial [Roseivivax marinus]